MFDFVDVGEERNGFIDRHFKDVVDVFAFVGDFQGFGVVAFSTALFTRNVNIRQEVHRDAFDAIALAELTASAFDVEGETAFIVTAHFGFGGHRKQVTDVIEDAGVGHRVGAWGTADRVLIDFDQFIDFFHPLDAVAGPGFDFGSSQVLGQGFPEDFIDEGGLPAAADPGHHGHGAQGEVDGEALKVIFGGVLHT